jgi:hypothetical protein
MMGSRLPLAALLVLAGCAGTAQEAVKGSISGFARPENWSALEDPTKHMVFYALEGLLQFLTDPKQSRLLSESVAAGMKSLGGDVAKSVDNDLGPAAARQASALLQALLNPPGGIPLAQRAADGAHDLARATVAGAVDGLGPQPIDRAAKQLAGALTNQLGPALKQVLADDVGGGMRAALEQQLLPVVKSAQMHEAMQNIGDGLAAGLADGAYQRLRNDIDNDPKLRAWFNRVDQDYVSFKSAAIAFGIAVLVAGVAALMALMWWLEKRRHAEALELVTSTIKEQSRGGPGSPVHELVRRIRERGRSSRAGRFLAEFVRRRGVEVKPEEQEKAYELRR